MSETFAEEQIQAARAYLGKPAIYHQDFVGNCIEEPSADCWEIGLGPDQFDCSGLIIRSTCDVLGIDVTDWPKSQRHAREMWEVANTEQSGLTAGELAIGSILTLVRDYHINGEVKKIPGHVGFITNLRGGLRYIHASPQAGFVKEGACRIESSILGAMTLDESWALVGASLVE